MTFIGEQDLRGDVTATRQLKLFGAFRSGSNYLRSLLELNYDVRVLSGIGGFKHAPVPAIFEGEDFRPFPWPILATVKDPYAWLVSMWRYVNDVGSKHTEHGSPWGSFLTEPLVVFQAKLAGFPKYRFANPVDYWNAMSFNLLSLPDDARRVVRYEDLLADPELECEAVATQFALGRVSASFANVDRRVLNMGDRERPREPSEYMRDEAFDPSPYQERAFDACFSKRERRTVHDLLDRDLCRRLGYRR
jgi:hypothetical protein